MAAKQPLSFKTIIDAIDEVEASIQAASPEPGDSDQKERALRLLEELREQIKKFCVPLGKKKIGPEYRPFRGI